MHSPLGLEYSIIKETGWTRDYLLWQIPWRTVRRMLADQPRHKFVKKGNNSKAPQNMTFEEIEKYWQQ